MAKNPRSKADLYRELGDQIVLLNHSCSSFDAGLEPVGRHISVSLRVLLHHKNRSRALLEQLGIRNGNYIDSAGPLDEKNLAPECNLVLAQAISAGVFQPATYVACCQAGGGFKRPISTPFTQWWTRPVLKDAAGKRFSRLDLVSHVADTDGGAHVDPTLDAEYEEMSRVHGLGWNFGSGPFEPPPGLVFKMRGRLELCCVRQIAWELIETLKLRGIS